MKTKVREMEAEARLWWSISLSANGFNGRGTTEEHIEEAEAIVMHSNWSRLKMVVEKAISREGAPQCVSSG